MAVDQDSIPYGVDITTGSGCFDLLNRLVKGDNFRQMIARADDPEVFAGIAQRSYLHQNGYFKVVMHRAEDWSVEVRLHHWPMRTTGWSDIHSHRWPYGALVLSGTLDEDLYEEVAPHREGTPYVAVTVAKGSATGGFHTADTRRVFLRKSSQLHHGIAEHEGGDPPRIHSVRPARDNTATLVVIGTPARDRSEVFIMPQDQLSSTPRGTALEASTLRDILQHALLSLARVAT